MKKVFIGWLLTGVVLLVTSILGLYCTIWFFPALSMQYFNPAFDLQSHRIAIYYMHPFIVSFALAWFWDRVKGLLTGSFVMRGIEFGLIYALVAILPMMVLIYSALSISTAMVATWFALGVLQGIVAGLIFEKINP